MKSLAARVLDLAFRFSPRRDSLSEVLDGTVEPTTSRPGSEAHRELVIEVDGRQREVWKLRPKQPAADAPIVLFLHGGAYVNGFHPFHWRFLTRLIRRTGALVVAPDYPLAPQSTAEHVVEWVIARYRECAATGRPVVLMGDSAGGGLAMAIAIALRDRQIQAPAKIVLLSPWLDGGMTDEESFELDLHDRFLSRDALRRCARAYAGDLAVSDWRVSPLFADLTGLPPTVAYCGTADQLIADSRRLAERAARIPQWECVVREYDGMVHDWMIIDFLPEARRALGLIAADVSSAYVGG